MENEKFYTARGYQINARGENILTASLEDYIEMIYRSIINNGNVRVNDLSRKLNVKPSSVSKMISKLSGLGFLDYEKYGVIRLTKEGTKMGQYLLWRHDIIKSFFDLISKDQKTIFKETELVEHILSKNTVENIAKLVDLIVNDNYIFKEVLKIKNCQDD